MSRDADVIKTFLLLSPNMLMFLGKKILITCEERALQATGAMHSRNSNVLLSVIKDVISRFQLQRLGSSVISQQPTRPRFITQSRPILLQDQTGANVSATTLGQDQGRDHIHDQSSTKFSKKQNQHLSPSTRIAIAAVDKCYRNSSL